MKFYQSTTMSISVLRPIRLIVEGRGNFRDARLQRRATIWRLAVSRQL